MIKLWTYLVATPLELHQCRCDGGVLVLLVHQLRLSLDCCELEQHLGNILSPTYAFHIIPFAKILTMMMVKTMKIFINHISTIVIVMMVKREEKNNF